jgi:hypothetical protein
VLDDDTMQPPSDEQVDPNAPPSWRPSVFFRSLFFMDPGRFRRVSERFQDYFVAEGLDVIGIETTEGEVSGTYNFAVKFREPGDAEGRVRTVRMEYDLVCGFVTRVEDYLCDEDNPGERPTFQRCEDTDIDKRRIVSRLTYQGSNRQHACRMRVPAE